jgi:two-component system chemotaxis response regulator CheY
VSDQTFDSISVMVVDDDDVLSQPAVTRIVENLGARVSLAALNGREAMERLEDRAVPVHLIICDVKMPEMGEFEFARRFRYGTIPYRKDLPILMLTGHDSDGNIRKGRIHKIDGFIVKPVTTDILRGHMTCLFG